MKSFILFLLFVDIVHADVLDTRGPVQNTGMRVVANAEGVQAPGYVWTEPEALSAWTAKWINMAPAAVAKPAASCLRQVFKLKAAPSKVNAWITGDSYLLWVNGHAAARGPADPGRDFHGRDFDGLTSKHRFYDVRDLTPLFKAGANALAVEVAASGGFLLQARVEYPDGSSEVIGTDETWRGIPCPYLQAATSPPPDEVKSKPTRIVVLDATAEPVGWQLPSFDDHDWPACKVGTPPDDTLGLACVPRRSSVFVRGELLGNPGDQYAELHAADFQDEAQQFESRQQ